MDMSQKSQTDKLSQNDFEKDIKINLSSVFYISQKVFQKYEKKRWKKLF